MTKAVVLYNSRGGNTKQVALKIAEGLGVDCFNHKNLPDLSDYDLLVLGSWVIMGRISFAGARYLRKVHRKIADGKTIALFFTSGGPDEDHPFADKENPKKIKEVMFEKMEEILTKSKNVTILDERFYSLGAIRVPKNKPPTHNVGHPNEEELAQAKEFGEMLKEKFEI